MSLVSDRPAPPWPSQVQLPVVASALTLLAALALAASSQGGWRLAAAGGLGALLGLTLYWAAFGFTGGWRRLLREGDGRGFKAQLVMLAAAVLLFYPALAAGELFGRPVWGFVSPVGLSVAVGAFLFGIGMQLGGGCASGTLFTLGGGSTRMLVTLIAFIAGSLIGTLHLDWWLALPSLGSISLVRSLGWPAALASTFALLGLLWIATGRYEARRGSAVSGLGTIPKALLIGAVLLALLNFATLWLLGRPWGITSGFALWGGKAANALGADLSGVPYWQAREGALAAGPFASSTSVMNLGLILGAGLAAGLVGRFRPVRRIAPRALLSAILGGLLLGYGARLAFGCNIGALFSGIASGSLHGWLWLLAALPGNLLGLHVKRWLEPPTP